MPTPSVADLKFRTPRAVKLLDVHPPRVDRSRGIRRAGLGGSLGASLRHVGFPQRGSLGARVLVAEDIAINQEVVTRMLELLGCEVTVVADGQAGVETFEPTRYDLVLMDCEMPRMDGFEATVRMREIEAWHGAARRWSR